MGRARRNQRDAIRKQRAKRRRKKGEDHDDEDDSDHGNDDVSDVLLPAIRTTSRSLKSIIAAGTGADTTTTTTKEEKKSNNDEHGMDGETETKSPLERNGNEQQINEKEEQDSNKVPSSTSITKCGATSTIAKKKAPMDKIERMRLKKQQQKARRKEKKGGQNEAAAIVMTFHTVEFSMNEKICFLQIRSTESGSIIMEYV